MKKIIAVFAFVIFVAAFIIQQSGCSSKEQPSQKSKPVPVFTMDYSEYISWSVYGVISKVKFDGEVLINPEQGKMGSIEKKWGVDLVMNAKTYEACFESYTTKTADAVCITNMDILPLCLHRPAVVVGPTSTSFGADACITVGINSIEELQSAEVFGLQRSVSEYNFIRNLNLAGKNEDDFKFTQKDPEDAMLQMIQGNKEIRAIKVWNPMTIVTLAARKDAKDLFNSTSIPGEIIDCMIFAQDSLDKQGGQEAACALMDAYYTFCQKVANPKMQDDLLAALGKEFKGGIELAIMKKMLAQSRFYATPEQGISLFTGGCVFPWEKDTTDVTTLLTNAGFKKDGTDVTKKTLKEIMPTVVGVLVKKKWVDSEPSVGYGSSAMKGNLRFDPTFMKMIVGKK